jgi:hypothetical protein
MLSLFILRTLCDCTMLRIGEFKWHMSTSMLSCLVHFGAVLEKFNKGNCCYLQNVTSLLTLEACLNLETHTVN